MGRVCDDDKISIFGGSPSEAGNAGHNSALGSGASAPMSGINGLNPDSDASFG